ncbi:MAG: hypothetical protein JXA44_04075 [Methanospirillaceae archaeon]|nr:hypothetical protein [Methanospirillaceae archaeon]
MNDVLSRTIENTPFSEFALRGIKACGTCKHFGVGNTCRKGTTNINPMCWCRSWRKRHD